MTLTYKQSRITLKTPTNVLELKSEYPIRKTSTHNVYEWIKYLVNIADTDIWNLHYKKSTKELKYPFLGDHNLIRSFTDYL